EARAAAPAGHEAAQAPARCERARTPERRRNGSRPDARLPPQPMTRGRVAASIVASPVLVGAVTTLIVIVSVFLAYNANTGLPFVPTYNLKAELPGGANLVPGNELRIGGFRVGVIDTIGTAQGVFQGQRRSIAVARLKLEKTAQPLPVQTGVL